MKKSPKPPEPFTFRHPYKKLEAAWAGERFHTVRGKAQFKRRKIGQIVPVETPTGNFDAVIVSLELRRVGDMTLEFLKADAEYPGCTISNNNHFVNLLNSFRSPQWTQVTMTSELCIITLQKRSHTDNENSQRNPLLAQA